MAFEKEKQFLEKMMADEELRTKVDAADPEGVIKIAQEAGFDITGEDLEKAAKEMRTQAAPKLRELSIEELDKVAGGQIWCGDDAPDGHEFGCTLTYYSEAYQLRNELYCTKNYFCIHKVYEGADMAIGQI